MPGPNPLTCGVGKGEVLLRPRCGPASITVNRMMRTRSNLVLVTTRGLAAGSEVHSFRTAGLTIVVASSESEFSEARTYQVVVSDDLRTLSRLEVNRDGVITDAWMTDLDGDGAIEIVVATGLLDGDDRGAVDIHEWQDGRFASTPAARLPVADRLAYRGNDQFSVENGQLWRAFPLFAAADGDGNAVPTGRMARFRYDYVANRWLDVVP